MTKKAEKMNFTALSRKNKQLITYYKRKVLEEKVLLRLKDFIAPEMLIFQFY